MRCLSVAGSFALVLSVAGCGDEKAGPIVGGMSWVVGCDTGCTFEEPHIQNDMEEVFKVAACRHDSTGYQLVVEASGNGSRPPGRFSVKSLNPQLNTCVVEVTEYVGGTVSGTTYTDYCPGTRNTGGCTVQVSDGTEGWDLQMQLICTNAKSNGDLNTVYKIVAARSFNDPLIFGVDNCK